MGYLLAWHVAAEPSSSEPGRLDFDACWSAEKGEGQF